MRPRNQAKGQDDLFRSKLDRIINGRHELVQLGSVQFLSHLWVWLGGVRPGLKRLRLTR